MVINNIEVSIVIVCMNNLKNLYPCLNSIRKYTTVSYETLVVAYLFSEENLEKVQHDFPWVTFIESNEIRGFIGLEDEYIAGVFVRKEARSKGTGKALLDYVKEIKKKLTLHVYVKNERAVRFYQREGFQILKKMTDDATGEEECLMAWRTYTPMKYERG